MATSTTRPSTSVDISMQDPESAALNAKILKPLDEVLRCRICFDYFTNCMMTKCNHNYCSVCIRRYMNYKTQCPTCFQVATEPELQNNRLIDEILRIYKKIRETLQISPESTSKSFPDHSIGSKSAAGDNLEKSTRCERVIHTESNQQDTAISTTLDEVSCPVCYTTVPNSRINIHLDSCLKQTEERSQRKFLPKLVYHLLSDKEIRKKLKEHGLSTNGNKQTLIRRHKNFITLFNANCDSLNPKPVSDLILEIERQELEERINAPEKSIQVNKKSDPSLIEKEQESYVQEHKSQFNALIQDVQDRIIGRKPIKKEFGFNEATSDITNEAGNVIGEATLKVGDASDQPVIIKEEPSESLLQDAYHAENPALIQNNFDSDYNKTSQISFRIKKEIPPVKMKEDSPSLLDEAKNQDLNVDSPSMEGIETSKMSISKFHKKKYVRRLSTEEKNTQRKK